MNEDKWYSSKLSKKGRIAHRPGHWRLGDNHSKCGHPIGKDVTSAVRKGYLDICQLCEIEVLKEKERIAKLGIDNSARKN